jgi:amino acid adenylation domain-containing protein/non-ribosomal peptide synthase protein (TIGR01720 family)
MHADRSDSITAPGSALPLELRSFLKQHLPDYMIPAAFVTLRSVPLLPNGKVDYRSLPVPNFEHAETSAPFVAPHTPIETQLARIWQQTLRVERVGVHDNFFELGGDSILSIQIAARASQAGIKLTPRQMFEHPTIAELARVAALGAAEQAASSEDAAAGPVPLTPIQRWFFEQASPEPQHFNQALLLSLRQPVEIGRLEEALQAVVTHHAAFRLRFIRDAQGWQQQLENNGSDALRFEIVDLAALPEPQRAAAMQAAAVQAQSSLDLEHGPVARAIYFRLGAGHADRLLLIVHHLVVDGVSWRILLEDLYTAYGQLERSEAVALPAPATPFHVWSRRLAEYARSSELAAQLDYWTADERLQAAKLPVDQLAGENSYESAQVLELALSRDETEALLHEAPAAYRTQINDLLLAALALTLARWTGHGRTLIALEGHGREELLPNVDLSRTVGWFTSLFPLLLRPDTSSTAATIKTIKEQLRAVPQRGIGYGLLRYAGDPEAQMRLMALPQPEISFNYFGQLDQTLADVPLFGAAPEPIGPVVSPRARRQHLLDINASVRDGRLRLEWTYSRNRHRQETVAALAESLLAALRELIAHCRSAEAGGYTPSDFPLAGLDQATIDRLFGNDRRIEAVYPLSSLQQGMLFHALYAPAGGDYITQMRFVFEGTLDRDAFVTAWQQVMDRYAILRTGFVWDGLDEPLQVVRKNVALPFALHDWRGLSEAEQTERMEAFLEADRRQGFDPAQAPLMRLALFHLAEDRYACVWSNHHLVIDGWSLPLVLDDMFALYTAARRGQPLRLPPAQPYAEYIDWLLRQDKARAEQFWRELLRGFSAPTPLGIDHAPGAILSAQRNYHAQWLHFSATTTQALQRLAREHRLTVNTLLQGAWAILLSRYSGQDDVVFGTTVSGRPTEIPGVERIVGMFVNTLPTRARLRPEQPLLAWLQELQAQESQVRQYEYSSLVQVQSWSEVPRGSQLFDSMMVFENYPVSASKLSDASDIRIEIIPSLEQTNYPLTLVAVPGEQLAVKLMYDRDHIDDDGIARMHGHFQTILEAMLEQIDRRLDDLPLLTAAEQQELAAWNKTAAPLPRESYSQLFEAQVARVPDATAVVWQGGTLSYRELHARAERLVPALLAHGVGPNTVVALLDQRGPELLAAILAVFKAGGAYLPLDPQHPPQRHAQILGEGAVPLVLTNSALREPLVAALRELTPDQRPTVLTLDSLGEQEPRAPRALVPNDPRDLAYVLFTSGSTGTPKGVMIEHQGMVNHLYAMIDELGLTAEDRIAQTASQCFDISVWQFLVALMLGGQVHIFDDQLMRDPRRLLLALEEQGITIFEPVPSLLRAMLDELGQPNAPQPSFERLRWVLPTGEALPAELARDWFQRYPRIPLTNAYGPAECSDDVTLYRLHAAPPETALHMPIGRPVMNMRVHLLDSSLRPVPIGIIGEIYIGGIGVGRGYLNRPDRSAEVFLPDPFAETAGARLYRSGDLGRYRADGALEFLGRIDQQVKVRGFRIELGEIEARLRAHPAVREAVVDVRDTGQGGRLIAYVVPEESAAAEPIEHSLREYLAAQLPEYMLPSSFMLLPALPLTANGKLDRKALPLPDLAATAAEFVAPRNEIEAIIADVWRDLLQLEQVSVHSRFLDLGGHSLLATRVTSRVGAALGIELPVRSLFEAPTIAELAELIAVIRWSNGSRPAAQETDVLREQGEL